MEDKSAVCFSAVHNDGVIIGKDEGDKHAKKDEVLHYATLGLGDTVPSAYEARKIDGSTTAGAHGCVRRAPLGTFRAKDPDLSTGRSFLASLQPDLVFRMDPGNEPLAFFIVMLAGMCRTIFKAQRPLLL